MDLLFAIAVVMLFGAPIALAGAYFVDRTPGFGPWRSDPWPIGVQEQDLDHAWGEAMAGEDLTAQEPQEPIVDDLPPGPGSDRPTVSRLRTSVRRAS